MRQAGMTGIQFLRSIEAELEIAAAGAEKLDPELSDHLKALAEEVHYAEPVRTLQTRELEERIQNTICTIQEEVEDQAITPAKEHSVKLQRLLQTREILSKVQTHEGGNRKKQGRKRIRCLP